MVHVDSLAVWVTGSALNAAGVWSAAAAWSTALPPRSARGLRRLLWLPPAVLMSAWLAASFDPAVLGLAEEEARRSAWHAHAVTDLFVFLAIGLFAAVTRRALVRRKLNSTSGESTSRSGVPTDLRLATEAFIAAMDKGDVTVVEAAYDPEFQCVRVADQGGFARLSRGQMLSFLRGARASASSHGVVRTSETAIHHAEILGDAGWVLLTRTKDLGNGREPLFYTLVWSRHAGGWRLLREFVHQRTIPDWAR